MTAFPQFLRDLDSKLRHFEFNVNRTDGGLLADWLGIRRHTVQALVLPTILAALLVAGPTPTPGWRSVWGFAAAICVFFALSFLMRTFGQRGLPLWLDLAGQLVVLGLLALGVWILAGPEAREFQGGLYQHVLIPFWGIFWLGLVLAALIAPRLLRLQNRRRIFEDALSQTELFVLRDPPMPVTIGRFLRSFLTEPLLVPLHLLLPPALVVMVMPPEYVNGGFWVTLTIAWTLLVVAGLHDRFNAMWMVLQEALFRGGALLVSLFVVALAGARFFGVSYVSTILDGVQGLTLILFVGTAYVLFWWYDYWTRRLASEQLLALLGHPIRGSAVIHYPIDPNAVKTLVPANGRVLQIHAAGRFAVVRPREAGSDFFHTHDMYDLFGALTAALSSHERPSHPSALGNDLPPYAQEARSQFSELGKQLFWYGALSTALPALLLVVWGLTSYLGVQNSQAAAGQGGGGKGVAVADLLLDEYRCRQGRPTIAVAASGGGTRAALYTASVLQGLQEIGHLADVRLGSGVSGGGAALAYFAARREPLIAGDRKAWNDFFQKMGEPYIQDVLNGAVEWRIAGATRLGALLAESFERRWQVPSDGGTLANEPGRYVKDFGLILNTALAGHFDRRLVVVSDEESRKSLTELERAYRRYTRSDLAGGRLIFTNLLLPAGYQGPGLDPKGELRLPIVVVNESTGVSLANAAALNANFPPVFPNAAVDVADTFRYWVTDGGAIDNRGMETLLYALKHGFQGETIRKRCPSLPPLHVIVVEASAYSDKYTQDRGLGTIVGAGKQFASQVAVEVAQGIREVYRKTGAEGRFRFHYLPMPRLLRQSGSFGTHWMLQPFITVRRGAQSITLAGYEISAILEFFHRKTVYPPEGPAGTVWTWAQEDSDHKEAWEELTKALGK